MASLQPAHGDLPNWDAAASELSTLTQLAAAFAAAVGARSAWIERPAPGEVGVEVVASAGPDAPPPGVCETPIRPPAGAAVLPLVLNGDQVGTLVAADVSEEHEAPSAAAVASEPEGETSPETLLELLALATALALRNADLRRQLEGAAAAATERHYRLIRGTAHHLKDVLGVASEYTQLLDMESVLTPRQQEYIRASRRNVDTAVRLITELLDLGRVESGRMPVEWGPVDVRTLVRGMLRDYQRQHLDREVTLEVGLDEPLPAIRSDIDVLRRVLDTLLSNAFKYAPERSTICISASLRSGRRAADPGAWVCVTVADEGKGVAERDDVFEEVSRAELSAGPGFRLAISRRLARLLGGDLTLDTPAGPGSTFTLWLPTTGPAPEL